MFCKKCGAQISEKSKFCPQCGEAIEHTPNVKVEMNQNLPVKPSKKKVSKSTIIMSVVSVFLAIALVISLLFNPRILKRSNSSMQGIVVEQGSKDKEELMNRFVKAIASNDFETALSCFPIQTVSEEYDYRAFLERSSCWSPSLTMQFPSNSDATLNLNSYAYEGACVDYLNGFVYSFLASDEYLSRSPVGETDTSFDKLVSDLDLSKLANLKITKMQEVNRDDYKSDISLKNRKKMASIYGADTEQDYVILYELNGTSYVGGVTFLVYGDMYYIYGLYAAYAGTNSWGYTEKISDDTPSYEEYVNGFDEDY